MKTNEERIAVLEAQVASLLAAREADRPVDLSDPRANFMVRKCPPKWLDNGGPNYAGEHISATTPEFCESIAGFLDWQAGKDEARNHSYVNGKGETVFPAKFLRMDASRARAWAKKLREQPRARPVEQKGFGDHDDGGIPF